MRKISRLLIRFSVLSVVLALTACVSATVDTFREPPDRYLYDSIEFEIAPLLSSRPTRTTLRAFRERLASSSICESKRISFRILKGSTLVPPMPTHVLDVRLFEMISRTNYDPDPYDRDLKVFVAYLPGIGITAPASGRSRFISGIQYSDTAFAVFSGGVKEAKQTNVFLHEFGHIIGLVVDKQRQDNRRPPHCPSDACVMFHSSASTRGVFCRRCQQEILALIHLRQFREYPRRG